jgi:hypothetical protein
LITHPCKVALVRYLTSSFAAGAISRGCGIDQLLGSFEEEGRKGLRYASIWPARRFEPVRVRLYEVEDLGPDILPMDEFPGFYPADDIDPENYRPDAYRRDEDGGRTIATTHSAEDALEIAERELGARLDRWVNPGVLLDEYYDYLQQGRPLGPWSPVCA